VHRPTRLLTCPVGQGGVEVALEIMVKVINSHVIA
jgi:hypothetical protein